MLKWFLRAGLLAVCCAVSACSVYMASTQPTKKDLTLLHPGTDRDYVIAEFGAPVISEPAGDGKKEIYTFVQGYSTATRASRAALHGVADVASIGLWEVVGTPVETTYHGEKTSVRIWFDKDNKIREFSILDGAAGAAKP